MVRLHCRQRIGMALADIGQDSRPQRPAMGRTTGANETLAEANEKMSLDDGLFGVHGKALALRSQRLSLLASNIANASTPGYKARDIDFEAALKEATDKTNGGADTTQAAKDAMGYRIPLQPSLDGNTVELSTEQTLFAENAVKYRTTLSFLEGRINTLTRALRGE
jgi:flagellar basal-body rod protein FlgB